MTLRAIVMLCLGALIMASPDDSRAQPAGHITGIGGVFFKAKDPKALAAWYRDVLGMPVQSWGGAALHYDAQNHPSAAAWSAFAASSTYFAPSTAPFKRMVAFDAVREDYQLYVRDTRLQPVPSGAPPACGRATCCRRTLAELPAAAWRWFFSAASMRTS